MYNALLCNHIEPKIENILRKNQNCFWRNRSTTSQILTVRQILEGLHPKYLHATILFVDFTKSTFIYKNSSVSNNSVKQYSFCLCTVKYQNNSISNILVLRKYSFSVKKVQFQKIKTVLLQKNQFSMSTEFSSI